MLVRDQFHLTYCTNIHPGQDWKTTFNHLKQYVPGIKKQVAPEIPFGLGLRLSNTASEELGLGEHLTIFRDWLELEGIYVFTMNGFPYGNFHNEKVKDHVHTPDWTTYARVSYTKRLFEQLAILLPAGMTGGISTSPVSYKHWHAPGKETDEVLQKAAVHLAEVVLHLHSLEEQTGRYLHLDIEPEPDGLLENTKDVLHFFEDVLLPVATGIVMDRHEIDASTSRGRILRYITICYDICHFSLAYEDPAITFDKLDRAGIKIGKIQVSAALKILSQSGNNDAVWRSLARFDEPVYLHQVTERLGTEVRTYRDLPEVLTAQNEFFELRAHFHVPVFLTKFGPLFSTQDHILKVFDILRDRMVSAHLEIETYTWEVLPDDLKKELSTSIIREVQWVLNQLGE